MSSLVPWVDRPQPLFDLYLKLDWLALGGTIVLRTDFKLMVAQQSEKGPNLKVVKWW